MSEQTLIALCGPPFVGKTTIGDALRDHYRYPFVAVDRFRPLLYGRSVSYAEDPVGDMAQVHRAYAAMRATTDALLGLGDSVIFECTLSKISYQHQNIDFLLEQHPLINLRIILCWIPDEKEEIIKTRVAERDISQSPSGATSITDHRRVRERFENIAHPHYRLDTSLPFEECLRQAIAYIDVPRK
ncbi:MAG: hypothetical protein RIQ54_424 [Candidatus Parcubacteria bacterium]